MELRYNPIRSILYNRWHVFDHILDRPVCETMFWHDAEHIALALNEFLYGHGDYNVTSKTKESKDQKTL